MKILLLITGLGVGGAERQVVDLADAFTELGHTVRLVCLTSEVRMRPKNPAIALTGLEMHKSVSGAVRALGHLRRIIQEFDPDVVHSHLVHANLLARLARVLVPMRVLISSAHNTNEEGWWRMLAYRLTNRLANVSTNVSVEAVQAFEAWRSVRPKSMQVIYNGVGLNHFRFDPVARDRVRKDLRVSRDGLLLLAVGRLEPQKDYPNLLRAFAEMKTHLPQSKLAIAGKGPLLPDLRRFCTELALRDEDIEFLGIRSDVPDLMSACDVFVLSSAWEGFGLVVAEAMACERTVVATDCGGVREVVGDVGFLVPPRDSPRLAQGLLKAAQQNPGEREAMGIAARQRVQSLYSIEAAARRWIDLYRSQHPAARTVSTETF